MTDAATPEFLTVPELATLLRLKERKIYDLAASGAVPCSKATGKLLFPAADVRAWIDGGRTGGDASVRPQIALGSHDPLLDWAIRESRCGLASFFDGSHDGLARFGAGAGIMTGLHIHDPQGGDWNSAAKAVAQGAVLVRFATRSRGIVYRTSSRRITGLESLKGMQIVPRQEESGTAGLFRTLASRAGLDLAKLHWSDVARTEDEAVQTVSRGDADAAFGLQSVAQDFGLSFVPVIHERFDILVNRKAWFDPAFQKFWNFCRTDSFRRRAQNLAGYDIADLGQVVWNG